MSKYTRIGSVVLLAGALSTGIAGCGGTTGGDANSSVTVASSDAGEAATAEDKVFRNGNDIADTGIWVPVAAHLRNDASDGGSIWTTADLIYEIDENGDPISATFDQDGTSEDIKEHGDFTFRTDADGLVISTAVTDASGETDSGTYEYEKDSSGRVISISTHDADAEVVYTLAYADDGWLSAVTGSGLTLTFDEDGRLLSKMTNEVSILPGMRLTYETRYEYDENGNLTRVTDIEPGPLLIGKQETEGKFECDDNGNMTALAFDTPDGRISMSYEYAYVANPSEGAKLLWRGPLNLLQPLA